MKRRAFLLGSGGLIATSALPRVLRADQGRAIVAEATDLPRATWRTLAAVQAHLLPSEANAPGAIEINAAGYLLEMLGQSDFDALDPQSLIAGAAEVERSAADGFGHAFADLPEAERETLLRAFEETDMGRRWIAGLLESLIEALLADPIYGGNPNGIGWRWLEHDPGHPRPTFGKRYFLLET